MKNAICIPLAFFLLTSCDWWSPKGVVTMILHSAPQLCQSSKVTINIGGQTAILSQPGTSAFTYSAKIDGDGVHFGYEGSCIRPDGSEVKSNRRIDSNVVADEYGPSIEISPLVTGEFRFFSMGTIL